MKLEQHLVHLIKTCRYLHNYPPSRYEKVDHNLHGRQEIVFKVMGHVNQNKSVSLTSTTFQE